MAGSVYHDEQRTIDGIHIPYAYEFANASARQNATGIIAADGGKFARQMDDNSVWMLLSHSPLLWLRISFDALHTHPQKTFIAGDGIELEENFAENSLTIHSRMQAFSTLQVLGQDDLIAPETGALSLVGEYIDIETDGEGGVLMFRLRNHAETHGSDGEDPIAGLLTDVQVQKLDSLDELAEPNQNAFSSFLINGQAVTAKTTTDALNLSVTGATVSVNDSTNTVSLVVPTSTGGSTGLVSHASTHLSGGSDPIPVANTSVNGLMPASAMQKINGIADGAQVNLIESVSGTGSISVLTVGKSVVVSSSMQQTQALATGATGLSIISPLTSGANLYFKRLIQGTNVTLQDSDNGITISAVASGGSSDLVAHAATHQTGGNDAIPVARATSNPSGGLNGLMAIADKDELAALRSALDGHKNYDADEHPAYIHLTTPRNVSARHTFSGGMLVERTSGTDQSVRINATGTFSGSAALGIYSDSEVVTPSYSRFGLYVRHRGGEAAIVALPKGLSTAGLLSSVESDGNDFANCCILKNSRTTSSGHLLNMESAGTGHSIKVVATNSNATDAINVSQSGTGNAMYAETLGTGRGVRVYAGDSSRGAIYSEIAAGNTRSDAYVFYGIQGGIAPCGTFSITNTASSAAALLLRHSGTGYLMDAVASNGQGIYVSALAGSNGIRVASGNVVINNGNLSVSGSLTKGSGTFKIDHPLDPKHKYLSHSFVESPDMKNIYDGVIDLDESGSAVIELPAYFEALNKDFRYQLTAVGSRMPNLHVNCGVRNNVFSIAGGDAFGQVSWQVTGIRKDRFALANPVIVEEDKLEPGYLHPQLFADFN